MADLLAFPDDEAKAVRRYVAQVRHWIARIDELTWLARSPFGSRENWIADARKVIEDIAHEPAAVRTECNLLSRLLVLKGLVDEAEVLGFIEVTASEPLALEMAREVNDDLRARMGARRAPVAIVESTPGCDGDWARERFMRASSLTPELVSDNLRLPGASRDAGSAAGPVLSPKKGRTGSVVAGAARFMTALFHAAKMRLLPHGVTEKGNSGFSHRGGPVHWGGKGGRS